MVLARTSDPPCFSVIAIPKRADDLPATSRPSYSRLSSRGSQRPESEGFAASAGTAEWVIETGQACPGSTWAKSMKVAALATFAPGLGYAQAEVCAPAATAARMIRS